MTTRHSRAAVGGLQIAALMALLCAAHTTAPAGEGGCGSLEVKDCPQDGCAATIAARVQGCSAAGGGQVQLGVGSFHLGDSEVAEMQPMIPLSGVANVTLAGSSHANGTTATTLVIHGLRWGFRVDNATGVSFRNFALDMARPPYTYGACVAVTNDSFTIKYDPVRYPFPVEAGGAPPAYLLRVQAILEFDPETWRPAEAAVDIYDNLAAVVDTAAGTYTVQGVGTARSQRIKPGVSFVLRHQVYGGNGFSVSNARGVTVTGVTLYSVPGMGFYMGDTTDVTLRSSAVRRRPGLPMSITADASHFDQCSGTIRLLDVHFEGQGDDGLNVHGAFHDVRDIGRDTPGLFTLGSRPAGGTSPLNAGELYEFRNRSTWAVEATARLLWYKQANGTHQLAQFNFSSQAEARAVTPFALASNIERQPAVHVANSYFGNNRARGNLIKTSNVLVEGSVFDHPSGPCLQAFPDGCYWFESGGFHNWTVTASRFVGCNMGAGANFADLFVAACAPRWQDGLPLPSGDPITAGQPFSGISVTNCTFEQEHPHRAVAIWGSRGVNVSDNTVGLTPDAGRSASASDGVAGSLDGFTVTPTEAVVRGWVVDPALPPSQPSTVVIRVNDQTVLRIVANASRPDLVPVVTSDPHHGVDTTLPAAALASLLQGNNTLRMLAVVNGTTEVELPHSPMCVNRLRMQCNFPQPCYCGAPVPPLISVSNSLACTAARNVCRGRPCRLELGANTTCAGT